VWGFTDFEGEFSGKKYLNFPLITPISGTFGFQKSLKVLSSKVFRFIQPALTIKTPQQEVEVIKARLKRLKEELS